MKYKIEKARPGEVSSIVMPELVMFAMDKKQLKPFRGLAFDIKDHQNKMIAGITAVIYYGCMFIELLWVEERYRDKGFGTQLMNKMEEEAIVAKCNMITITTMDWEAKPFYEKLGYYLEFERHGYYENSIRYFLRKDIKKNN